MSAKITITKCASWQEAKDVPGVVRMYISKSYDDALKELERSHPDYKPVECRWCERKDWNEYCFVARE